MAEVTKLERRRELLMQAAHHCALSEATLATWGRDAVRFTAMFQKLRDDDFGIVDGGDL